METPPQLDSAAAEPKVEKASSEKQTTDNKAKKTKKGDKKPNQPTAPKPIREWTPTDEKNQDLLLTIGEECISTTELRSLLLRTTPATPFRLYDGFEPSGRMHIAQGVFKAMNVNKATESGGHFIFWVADWFALMNDKMGGDLSKIRVVGQYLQEVWKAAGMKKLGEAVHFLWASEQITEHAGVYWPLMLDVARRFNVTRIKKCCQIMGRLEGSLTAAQVLYPLMQCTDVFFLKADICQLGVDQRKVNMLAREYADFAKKKVRKPIILSHHMLYGLKEGQEKMSKSDPDSAIFMEDEKEDVERKIINAYCPRVAKDNQEKGSMQLVQDDLKNPCLDYIKNIIFAPPGATFSTVNQTYHSFEKVQDDFLSNVITEEHLKRGLIDELNKLLEPVRHHFKTDQNAKTLLEKVRHYKKEVHKVQHQIRKLDLVTLEVVPAKSHVVFLPAPCANPTVQSVMNVLGQANAVGEDTHLVLYLSDWSAIVCNSLDADSKAIESYYTIFMCALKALGLREKDVTIVKQSEAILKDSSNYWISVINIGRFFGLDEVMGEFMKDSDGVGTVIARLMKVADALSLSPSSIAFNHSDVDKDTSVEMMLINKYLSTILPCDELPSLTEIATPSILLMQRENVAHKLDTDEYFILDDPKVNGKSKMKKAFCEPGNISFCPVITLSFLFSSSVLINRSEENGGNITYTSQKEIEADFESGSLHPGDLKNSATPIAIQVLTKLSEGIKKDGDASKASKSLKAFAKKLAKQQKK